MKSERRSKYKATSSKCETGDEETGKAKYGGKM